MKAVILAGGKGTRLKPYTMVFPKPLMPVGDRPILEIIIRQLESCGFEEIVISVGHFAELIINYFHDGSKLGVNIKYSRENEPLGTAGGLGLLREELKETFLMINGDTLTTLNFLELVKYHKANGAIATIAAKRRGIYHDFGIIRLDSANNLKEYIEKPTIEHLTSMGVYALEPAVLQYIKSGERLDFPDLVKILLSKGETVKGFQYDGYWLDIGRPEDYEKAQQEVGEIYRELGLEVA